MDAFISHSSADRSVASRLEEALEAAGLRVWLDDSEIRLGALLGKELQDSIRASRVVLLLWSRDAASSRWVTCEWLTAFHLNRYIVPCVLDDTPLPQCLQGSIFLRMRRVTASVVERLVRAVREAPSSSNVLAPVMRSKSPEVRKAIARISRDQQAILGQLPPEGKLTKAAQMQAQLGDVVDKALHRWPLEPMIVNLAGYHLKNAYVIKYWDAIQAGRAPDDRLLDRAEKRFFKTLELDPTDYSSLNGLGNILMFRRDLDAAEFFHLAAIAQADRENADYPQAENDLALVRGFQSRPEGTPAEAESVIVAPSPGDGSAVPTADGRLTSPPSSAPVVDGDVRFTVYRPQVMYPEQWASLLVFAHKTNPVVEPGGGRVDPQQQVEARASAHFRGPPPRPAGDDARQSLTRGAQLRIVPDLPGIRCNPGDAGIEWWEPVHEILFRLLAGPELAGTIVRGAVRIWCGAVILGEVSIAIHVAADGPVTESPPVAESAQRYRKIFPSYSHRDRAMVANFAEAARALGDQYLQDVLALRAGEEWNPRLLELIEDADVFQLFWSRNSMRSPHCRDEWEHALSLRRPLFIRPVYWEDPLPEDPGQGVPPAALRALHFVKVPAGEQPKPAASADHDPHAPLAPKERDGGPHPRVDGSGALGVQVGKGSTQIFHISGRQIWAGIIPPPLAAVSGVVDSPYRGLNMFEERDAPFFFGREAAATQVLARMSRQIDASGLLVVSGVSGAGKSSLLRAGVLPRLRAIGLMSVAYASSWPCLLFTPGRAPLDELAMRIAGLADADAAEVRRGLDADPAGFALTARQAALAQSGNTMDPDSPAEHRSRLLLIVDQFEQLFTQCPDEAQRRAFITALHAAAMVRHEPDHEPAALVVLGVRADFEARCADYPQLAGAIQDRYLVTAMTERQLRLAITEPAKKAGSSVEDDLADELLRKVRTRRPTASSAGALPLLSHALDQAWRTRTGEVLTLADYERTGGIEWAMAASAQRAYDHLTAPQRAAARQVFIRLATTRSEGVDTAGRVARAELTEGKSAAQARDIEAVLEAFTAERLLVLAAGTVEISHEILLTAWPLLRDTWLTEIPRRPDRPHPAAQRRGLWWRRR
jgi:hypothetical protein